MNFHAVVIAAVSIAATACGHDAPPAPAPAPAPVAPTALPTAAPSTPRDAAAARDTAAVIAGELYAGRADGRGAEPPIHEFAAHVVADAWTAQGTAQLHVPARDGPVDGELRLGALVFRARGYRVGPHVRATLEPRAEGDAGPAEDAFRGTLDADVASDGRTLRGSWQASSEAGVHRRQGSVEAQRQ